MMTAIENLEIKLNELTQLARELEAEKVNLKQKLGCLQESVETLEGHGIDSDSQIEKIKAHVGIEEVSPLVATLLGSSQKPYLRLVDLNVSSESR